MTTKPALLFSLCLAAGALMLACGGGDSAGGGATASGDKVGVAECDDFLTKYETCISGKVPAAAQATFKKSMDDWRKAWKEQANNPQTKSALAQVCKTSMEQTKAALSSYNCTW
ncbi:MAG TPA: hypothetical protein VM936_16025 [Pyrinomonadaceae bacterium]|jgi:hypothetical protein|nr:hypothetical protein [Pyrinomonadaceae bacterium]